MQITPRVFAPINPRSLAGGEKQRRGGRPNPGERGSPAARLGVEELKGSKPHPLVLVAQWETVGEGGSVAEGNLTAWSLRLDLVDEEWSASCARTRRIWRWGWRGRSGCGGAVRWRA